MRNWIASKVYFSFPQTREEDLFIRLLAELLFAALTIVSAHFFISLISQIDNLAYLQLKILIIVFLTIYYLNNFIIIFEHELPIIMIIIYFSFVCYCVITTIANMEMPNFSEISIGGGLTDLANKTVNKGVLFSSTGEKYLNVFRLNEGDFKSYNEATYHFQNPEHEYKEYDIQPGFEPTQKLQMWKRTSDLNQFYRNNPPIKMVCPHESSKLFKFAPQGGDIILMEGDNTDLIIVELKFRHKVFDKVSHIIDYCNDLNNAYKSLPVIVDVDNKLAYYQLLNYLKECPERYNETFCFLQEDLQLPHICEQLDSFKVKNKFSHIIVRDVSCYLELATKDELLVAESMKIPLEESNSKESLKAAKVQLQRFNQDSSFKLRNVEKATEFLIEKYSNPGDDLKIKYERPEY